MLPHDGEMLRSGRRHVEKKKARIAPVHADARERKARANGGPESKNAKNAGAQTAASFSSPVRMRITRSTSATKILPSPILPVRAAPMIASMT